jgi:hypothetical protein
MDGTLVDTEPYWIEREHELVREHGNGAWTDEHAHALVGFDLRDSARYISEHGQVDLPVDDIVNLLLDGVIERVRRRIPWRPGARELLADLRSAGVPCALVTMSWRRFADAVVEMLPPDSFRRSSSATTSPTESRTPSRTSPRPGCSASRPSAASRSRIHRPACARRSPQGASPSPSRTSSASPTTSAIGASTRSMA